MDKKTIDRMNKDLYRDELDHKVRVYDGVKATLQLCNIMIQALEPTSELEQISRQHIIDSIWIARENAILSATDVEIEQRGLPK